MFVDKTLNGDHQNKEAVSARVLQIIPGHGQLDPDLQVEDEPAVKTNDAFICDLVDDGEVVVHKNAAFSSEELPFEWTAEDQTEFERIPEPEPASDPDPEEVII